MTSLCQNYAIKFANKSISLHTKQVNCLEKWTENWSVVGIVIIENPCSSVEQFELDTVSYEVKTNYLIEQSP